MSIGYTAVCLNLFLQKVFLQSALTSLTEVFTSLVVPCYTSTMNANRFSPLSNLESGEYVPTQRIHNTTNIQTKGNKIPTIVNGICVSPSELPCTTFKQEETTHINSHQTKMKKTQFVKSVDKVKHKVILINDSHARNRAHLLQDNRSTDLKVSSFVKPGAHMNEVINTVREELKTLKSDDLVVVWGGANDIRKNNMKEALNSVSKFVNENKELNVVLTPHTDMICYLSHV